MSHLDFAIEITNIINSISDEVQREEAKKQILKKVEEMKNNN